MKIGTAIKLIKESAKEVFGEPDTDRKEDIYQKAMKVCLRHKGLQYETQSILPITFSAHVIGESIPDLNFYYPLEDKK